MAWPASDPQLGETVRDVVACTVGLVGYGNIARQVANIVARWAPGRYTSTRDDGLPGWRPLSELVAASDVVSLHLPLTADTEELIDRAVIAGMKPGAVLVNTSRGPIVDEDALAEALRDGRLAAAGLDVFGVEPVPPDNPLLGLANVVLTPHVTWYTAVEHHAALSGEAVANCRRMRDGQQLAHVVNQPTGWPDQGSSCHRPRNSKEGDQCRSRSMLNIKTWPIRCGSLGGAGSVMGNPARRAGDAHREPAAVDWQAAADQGLQGVHLAESVGGQGFGILDELAITLAEFGYGAVPGPFVPSAMASALIAAHGRTPRCWPIWRLARRSPRTRWTPGLTATPTGRVHWSSAARSGRWPAAAAAASLLVLPVAIDSGEEWVVLPADQLEIEPVKSLDPLRPIAHACAPMPSRYRRGRRA